MKVEDKFLMKIWRNLIYMQIRFKFNYILVLRIGFSSVTVSVLIHYKLGLRGEFV